MIGPMRRRSGSLALLALALAAPAQQTVEVRGRAVGREGEPLPGTAVVALAPDPFVPAELELDTAAVLVEGPLRTGADGSFRIEVPQGGWIYLAAEGRVAQRVGHARLLSDRSCDLGDVTLVRGVVLVGRVQGPGGRPLGGARVMVRGRLPGVGTRWALEAEVNALAAGTSGADGIFRIPCVAPAGLEVTVFAAGHGLWTRFPVSHDSALSIELEATGYFAGRVLDAEGAPVEARVELRQELSIAGGRSVVRSAADGRFRITRLVPGRARLVARVPPEDSGTHAVSAILEGPDEDLELRPAGPGAGRSGTGRLRIRVVDPDGAPIAGARVRAVVAPQLVRPWSGDLAFRPGEAGQLTAADGGVELTLAQHPGRDFLLRVDAPGRARVLRRLGPDEADLQVELGPEARVAGRVVDADGNPVAGARAWWLERGPAEGALHGPEPYVLVPDGAVRTGADGRFELRGVPAARIDVQVEHPDHLVPGARQVLAVAGETAALEVALARGRRIEVLVRGARAGLMAALRPTAAPAFPDGTQAVYGPELILPAARSAGAGRFVFEPVRHGPLALGLTRPSRTALSYPLFFDVAKIGALEDGEIVVPESRVATGTITGRVRTPDVPFARVSVDVVRAGRHGTFVSPLDPAGRYRLEVPTGTSWLRLVDTRSGLVVARVGGAVEVAAEAEVERHIESELRMLRVELVPELPGGIVRPAALHFRTAGPSGSSGLVELGPGEHNVDLLVPAAGLSIKVRDGSGLLAASGHSPIRWLAEVEVAAEESRAGRIRIAVEPPLTTEQLEGM
jgi:hypothetical protein